MEIYAPRYYGSFRCIADQCRHSCCIGWEIDVDEATMKRYGELPEGGYGDTVRESIDEDPTPHFRLGEGARCPHLAPDGLCRLILALGEDCLCHICREHPRFYNETNIGREVGLGMACEEACRLILQEEDYVTTVAVASTEEPLDDPVDFDALTHRARVYGVLSDTSLLYGERLRRIARRYRVSPGRYGRDYWRELLGSLEYLDERHRAWSRCYTSRPEVPSRLEPYLERAFAYFVFRHCTAAADLDSWRLSLGLCLVLERFLASLAVAQEVTGEEELILLARAFSEELEYSEENTDALRMAFL